MVLWEALVSRQLPPARRVQLFYNIKCEGEAIICRRVQRIPPGEMGALLEVHWFLREVLAERWKAFFMHDIREICHMFMGGATLPPSQEHCRGEWGVIQEVPAPTVCTRQGRNHTIISGAGIYTLIETLCKVCSIQLHIKQRLVEEEASLAL